MDKETSADKSEKWRHVRTHLQNRLEVTVMSLGRNKNLKDNKAAR